MWEYEYSAETSVPAEAIWKLWADVEGWGAWDAGLAKVYIDGPFAVGSTITMAAADPDPDPVRVRIAELVDGELFVDEADFDGVLIRTIHRLDRLGGDRIRVRYRTEITGPAADQVGPELGPAITGDFPAKVAALLALAEGR